MLEREGPPWVHALDLISTLTPREYELFRLLRSGASNQELADVMFVSERTIRAHLAQIVSKLHVSSRIQLGLASYMNEVNMSVGLSWQNSTETAANDSGAKAWSAHTFGLSAHPSTEGEHTMKKQYQCPQLTAHGGFAENTAGFGRFTADQLVGRLIL